MLSDTVVIPRARAIIRHSRLVQGKYEVVDEQEALNLLLDGGRVALHTYIYGTAAQRVSAGLSETGFNYVAISGDAAAPLAGDTSLAGELSADGLARAQGVVTLPTGVDNQTVITYAFTYVGVADQLVQKVALFDAAVSGMMAHEILFTPRTLATNDVLAIQYALTVG